MAVPASRRLARPATLSSRHWRRSAPNGSAAQADGAAQVAALAKSSSWERGAIVEKSRFALMPGSKTTDSDVARACGEMLATPVATKS